MFRRIAALAAGAILAAGLTVASTAAAHATTWADTSVQVVQPPDAFVHYFSYSNGAESDCVTVASGNILTAHGNAPATGHGNTWTLGTLPLALPNLKITTDGTLPSGRGVLTDGTDTASNQAVTAFVNDGYGDQASVALKVSVSGGTVTAVILTWSCDQMDTPANLAGGIQFTADDLSNPAQTITGWSAAGLPAGLSVSGSGVIGLGSAAPGLYSGVEVIAADGNVLDRPSGATITFTLKVSAHAVPNTGNSGDEVNGFGNGFDVFRQDYAPGAVIAGWTATRTDPATNFVRISRGAGVWQFEAVNSRGIATGLCVSDPGGGVASDPLPDGLILRGCNSGPWQQFRVLTAEPSQLQDVATGLVVWPDGTGAQLRGSATPIGGVSNLYTWMDNASLP